METRAPNLPKFLVVGAAKAGTTSIYYYLKQHPSIFLSEIKESNFLVGFNPNKESAKIHSRRVVTKESDYYSLFETAQGDQVCGEVCPLYLYYHDRVIPRIKRYLSEDTKIIIVLRNPVDRWCSGYGMYVSLGLENLPPAETLLESNYSDLNDASHWRRYYNLTCGLYFRQIRAYLTEFGCEKVRIFRYEDLKYNPGWLLGKMTEFLELPVYHYDTSESKNVTKDRKSDPFHRMLDAGTRPLRKVLGPHVSDKLVERYRDFMRTERRAPLEKGVLDFLRSYYRKDIENLQGLLGCDLGLWLNGNETPFSKTARVMVQQVGQDGRETGKRQKVNHNT